MIGNLKKNWIDNFTSWFSPKVSNKCNTWISKPNEVSVKSILICLLRQKQNAGLIKTKPWHFTLLTKLVLQSTVTLIDWCFFLEKALCTYSLGLANMDIFGFQVNPKNLPATTLCDQWPQTSSPIFGPLWSNITWLKVPKCTNYLS